MEQHKGKSAVALAVMLHQECVALERELARAIVGWRESNVQNNRAFDQRDRLAEAGRVVMRKLLTHGQVWNGSDEAKALGEALAAVEEKPSYCCGVCGRSAHQLEDGNWLVRINQGETPSRWRCRKHLAAVEGGEP